MAEGFTNLLMLTGVWLAGPPVTLSTQRISVSLLSASREATLHSEGRAAQLLSPSRAAALKVQGDVINV